MANGGEADGRAGAGTPARILVVDDEESITQLLSTALRYEGFAVRTAGSGRAALTEAAAFRPDLVLLDVMLPDLDGFEVAPAPGRHGVAPAGGLPHRARARPRTASAG